jgi:hypothetical protein
MILTEARLSLLFQFDASISRSVSSGGAMDTRGKNAEFLGISHALHIAAIQLER